MLFKQKLRLRCGAPFGKKIYVLGTMFLSLLLDHNLSNICIGNIGFICRTNCTLSRTKKHAQNKSDKIVLKKKNDFVILVFINLFRP